MRKLGVGSGMWEVTAGCESYGSRLRCRWAVARPGRTTRRRTEQHQPRRPHWCGGCRRDRRARAGFEIDHSERSSRVAISRAAGPSGARNTSGATSNNTREQTARGRATAHGQTRRRGCGGRRRDLPRCRWAVAGPGRVPRQRIKPHTSTPGPTGVEGAGGTCRGARGRRRGLAGLRDDAPSEARSADGSRAGRRPPAHTAAGRNGAQPLVGTQNRPTPQGPGGSDNQRETQRRITTMSGSPRPLS